MADGSNVERADFGENPELLHDVSITEMYSMPLDQVADFQLKALNKRFKDLVGKVSMLGRLAEEQKITSIQRFEDAGPLLFPHSHYKSYSISLLETGRFDRLTRWLNGQTVHDLTKMDTDGVETIDEWIDALDNQTDIRVLHSSGTTGKLSFIPRSVVEHKRGIQGFRRVYEGFGDEPNSPLVGIEDLPVIIPTYRKGAMGLSRTMEHITQYLHGGRQDKVIALYPGRISADMLSLAGRIRVAESKGEAGRLTISPKLMARREAFLQEQAEQPARRQAFFDEIIDRFRSQRVILSGNWALQYDVAIEAQKKGVEKVFAPDSLLFVAGGTKGRDLPSDYKDVVRNVLGLDQIRDGYGMSEIAQMMPACPCGNHHIQTFAIPYLLDPKTGEQRPRHGRQTGRFGFVDLMAETYWGGFLSGDEVTIDWGDNNPCACGRLGSYILPELRRYSEQEGGDDKITCAGAPEAHDKALDFLAGLA